MKGHIRKRGKNSWAVVVDLPRDPETGKRRQRWVTVQGTKEDAERELAKLLVEHYSGGLGTAPARLTLGEYLDSWLKAIGSEIKPSTAFSYRTFVRLWRDTPLAGAPLIKLTPLEIQKALSIMLQKLSPETVKKAHTLLATALRRAVNWGLLAKNPIEGMKPPRTKQQEMQVWTEEEAAKFLESAKKSKHYTLFVLALSTGMRMGELLGLKWEDVDLEAGYLQVKRVVMDRNMTGGEVVFLPPKTGASRRKIPLERCF